ncbi:MAG: restriction endonuclease subunit S [Bacteroidetes bacterium]|nr:restriction endonuclease subunit S [Bacteroidota bacterium]
MNKLKAYKKYKPVDYDYVNELPVDWQLLPNIAIFQERIERDFVDEELLSVTIRKGVIKQADVDIKKDSSNEDKSKYKLIKVGDIAYNKMRMWQGALGYSQYNGISSPAYVILNPKMKINSKYFHFMFRTGFYTNYSKRISYGIVDDQLSLRYKDFKRMYSIVPPLETQNTIVEYLDRKTKKTQEFISKKERLIELLEERRKSEIITEINKISNKIKLKYVLRIQNGDGIPSDLITSEGDFQVYGGNGVLGYYNSYNNDKETLVIGRVGALCGNVHYSVNKIWVNDNAMFANTNNFYKYVYYVLKAVDLNKLSFANAQPLITGTLVKNKYTNFTSDRNQQKKIVNNIEVKLSTINNAITKAQTEIKKIKEYQESLITQVVTGDLKVPAERAGKPDLNMNGEL